MALRSVLLWAVAIALIAASTVEAAEYRFVVGMRDGSEPSPDGAEYVVAVEAGGTSTEVFREMWTQQAWSDEQVVDLSAWGGQDIVLVTVGSPGPARDTGWDWLAIGDPRITMDGATVIDLVAIAGEARLSMLLDGDADETDGLDFGATFNVEESTIAGVVLPGFFQHPAWNGRTGDTIARFDISVPGNVTAVDARQKAATTWADIKGR